MSGLYIHIPFCRSKCDYCDFFSMPLSTARRWGEDVYSRYVEAIIAEYRLRHREVPNPFATVYIGGGTPSALPKDLLLMLISRILEETGPCQEVTIECNPEDITPEMLHSLKEVGVNRISIGVQSFDDSQLSLAGRHHTAAASSLALEILAADGINYNADLIYGLPGQSLQSWHLQLATLLAFRPPHLSAYLLSYEPGTRLYARRERGAVEEAEESLAAEMYRLLCREMAANGYDHYEISNFSQPGLESRHNSAYWNLTPYLGLGCSAHSFDGVNRRFNPSNLKKYIDLIEREVVAAEIDRESMTDRVNDYIITSLRTTHGLSLPLVEQKWGSGTASHIRALATPFIRHGQLQLLQSNLIIPERHWLTADSILRDMMLE